MNRKSLRELNVPTFHPKALHWRKSTLVEVKSSELIGKQFKTTKGKIFTCKNIDKNYVYFHNIRMERRYALFYLPTEKQLTEQEQIDFLKKLYPESKLIIGKGCQLHGDIDAELTLKDGTIYTINWNY